MAGEHVYIGIKSHQDLILDLDKLVELPGSNGRLSRVTSPERVTLKGDPAMLGPKAKPSLTIHGYVFTPVPADFWAEWLKLNPRSPLMAEGVIIEAKSLDAGTRMAAEREKERGLNPRLTEGDVRANAVRKFDVNDERAAA